MYNFTDYIDSQRSGLKFNKNGLYFQWERNNKNFNSSAFERLFNEFKVSFQGSTLTIPELNFKCSGTIVKQFVATS